MTSSRPYLLRGLFEWILDNHLTPYVLINALDPDVSVPQDFINDGRIILNITPGVVSDLEMTNELIRCQARFGGIPQHIYAPIKALMAIYAKKMVAGWFSLKIQKIQRLLVIRKEQVQYKVFHLHLMNHLMCHHLHPRKVNLL